MSQDKLVTPDVSTKSFPDKWLSRSLALAPVMLFRLRNIERIHGSLRRSSRACGCEKESRFPSPSERAVVWGVVQPIEDVRQVLVSTPCRLLPFGWLVLSPNGGIFAWAEIVELHLDEGRFLNANSETSEQLRPLEQWEALCGSDLKFRVCQRADESSAAALVRTRHALVRELLQRNPQYSHVNLSLPDDREQFVLRAGALQADLPDFEVELLRERFIPNWRHCGDMAYRRFTAYTVMRKDI